MKTELVAKKHAGGALIEALVSIVVFTFGVLGLLGLQAVAIKNSSDANYRSNASYLANQIIGQIWVDRTNIDDYAHYPTGANCNFAGSVSSNGNVTQWITQVTSMLPGAASSRIQIQVIPSVGDTKRVTVTVCWQTPQENTAHNFVITAEINQ